ncbi:MAG: hypothetical protein ACP5GJ_03820 [Nanopusillaceae archaeon]|jgi:hypothetical protein
MDRKILSVIGIILISSFSVFSAQYITVASGQLGSGTQMNLCYNTSIGKMCYSVQNNPSYPYYGLVSGIFPLSVPTYLPVGQYLYFNGWTNSLTGQQYGNSIVTFIHEVTSNNTYLQFVAPGGVASSSVLDNPYSMLSGVSFQSAPLIQFTGSSATISYIGVGNAPGIYSYELGQPVGITQQVSVCPGPIVNIISPVNGSSFNVGQPFTLEVQDIPQYTNLSISGVEYIIYINNQVYTQNITTPSQPYTGSIDNFSITLNSGGNITIQAVVAYQYSSGCIGINETSIKLYSTAPLQLVINSIGPLNPVPNTSLGYPVVSSPNMSVQFTLSGNVLYATQTTCTVSANLLTACASGSQTSVSSTAGPFSYTGPSYTTASYLDMSSAAQGIYQVTVTCSVGSTTLSKSVQVLYAYDPNACSLYCSAQNGYYNGTYCCGLNGQPSPSQVTGYPNPTYYNASTCSLVSLQPGQCVNNNDVPPPGWTCLNSTTVAYVTYSCSVNYPSVNPPGVGQVIQNITQEFGCGQYAYCSYGQCVQFGQNITPSLTINVIYPQQGQTVYAQNGQIYVQFIPNDTLETQVACMIYDNGQIVGQGQYTSGNVASLSIPVQSGQNTLNITCADINNVTNSTVVQFTVSTGYIVTSPSECGIPYVCLSPTQAAYVQYNVVNGICNYTVIQTYNASTGQYCFGGFLINANQVNVQQQLFGQTCAPDAMTIVEEQLTPSSPGVAVNLYPLQAAPFRCLLGLSVTPQQLQSFNGMIIPVCTQNNTIVEYQIIAQNGTIYFQNIGQQACNNLCVAGLCVQPGYTIQPPTIQLINVPTNVSVGQSVTITFEVGSPYPTAYVQLYIITPTNQTLVYSGVVNTNIPVSVSFIVPDPEQAQLYAVAEDPSGLTGTAIQQIIISSVTPTTNITTPSAPITPSVSGISGVGAALTSAFVTPTGAPNYTIIIIIIAIVGGLAGAYLSLKKKK